MDTSKLPSGDVLYVCKHPMFAKHVQCVNVQEVDVKAEANVEVKAKVESVVTEKNEIKEISDAEKAILDQYIAGQEPRPIIKRLQHFLFLLSLNTNKGTLRSHLNYYMDNRRNPPERTYSVFLEKI
jgi:hypothetical protein